MLTAGWSETAIQIAVVKFVRDLARFKPELRLLHHIPNGGSRDKKEAAILSAMGVEPGVLDLHLPIARGKYIGLWVEMKSDTGKPSKAQLEWAQMLRDEGHYVQFSDSASEAIDCIMGYIKLPKGARRV